MERLPSKSEAVFIVKRRTALTALIKALQNEVKVGLCRDELYSKVGAWRRAAAVMSAFG